MRNSMKSKMIAAALAVAALGLQGCTTGPKAVLGSSTPVYATDLRGKAASCTVPAITPVDGRDTAAAMTTGGGGWCGLSVRREGRPYAAGLLTEAAHNGKVYVHTVGDDTRIDYTPRTGAAGPDAFAVRLLPGDAVIRVAVNTAAPVAGK
jgi:hypothetical protein